MERVTRRTRWTDEATRTKDTYEEITDVAAVIDSHERHNLDQFAELIRELAGLDTDGHHDPDLAYVGRCAALRWLRENGYIGSIWPPST